MSIRERIKTIAKATVFEAQPPFPHVLMLEPSSACNQSCLFCGNDKRPHRHRNLPMDRAASILTQAYALGTREVGFYLRGEPFLNPRLADMVALAKQLGYEYVYLSTNGSVGSWKSYVAVIDAGIDSFKFSINAGKPDDYAATHGLDVFSHVIDRLRRVIAYREESGAAFKIYVSSTYTAATKEGILALRDEFAPRIDEFYVHGTCRVPGEEGVEVERFFRAPCPMVFNRLHVTAEGYLNLCCFDFKNALAAVDLNVTPLAEAWNSPLCATMRKRHMDASLENTLCGNCVNGTDAPYAPLVSELADKDVRP
ncbi:radical SAM protein [Desulfovibrio oxamicus]|uniref:Radical SAM protein n=1 Tax=Nitratidesulfovibrio oxamicus TaxID=32016 RepID=A0ABS0J875_9BACT|nr:radical SAM/SPASM domain-containing protein [Nitratidesulfovibrio oxamicus]MBG3878664.1 radical SAM protein [Nitratidesulfovibrio oxamicus]